MNRTELAIEISTILGGETGLLSPDVEAIEDWLLEGKDDGSPIEALAERFDQEVGLPSQQ